MAQTPERSTVVGVFDSRGRAEQAIEALEHTGFRDDQIGIVTQGEGAAGRGTAPGMDDTHTGEVVATGAVAGGVLGGLLGAAASLLIPGIGPVLAGGILATTLGGAALGAAAGGIIGALTGMGIPEEEARYYETELKSGRTLVTVKANGRSQEATAILRRFGAYDAHTQRGTAPRTEGVAPPAGTAGPRTGGPEVGTRTVEGEETIQLREEGLRARKQPVETGEVEVRKEVVTEQRTVEVPVQREEVYVERHPVEGREVSDRPIGEGESIRVPVRKEEVTVEKQPVVREELEVGKRQIQDTEQVSGTVRREVADIDREGRIDVDEERKERRR